MKEFKSFVAKSGLSQIIVVVPDGSYRGARKMASKYAAELPRGKHSRGPKLKRN